MNKDLMMKAVVQFKAVWPDGATHILNRGNDSEPYESSCFFCAAVKGQGFFDYKSLDGVKLTITPSQWQQFCTRNQFESFVESLFEGAPEGATHYSPEDKNNEQAWWKLVGDEMLCICETGGTYIWERGHFDKTIQLIPRPAKKAEPQAPWVPEIGEECKSALLGSHFTVGRLLYKSDQLVIWQDSATGAEFAGKLENRMFRPLLTERELFIEQATKDYLDRVGSDAVNPKWFERIFGAMYDKKYRKEADQ